MIIEIIFWTLFFLITYSYIGYAVILLIILALKHKERRVFVQEFPPITLLIAAFNEKDILEAKLLNTAVLDYPKEKITQLWITDGSTDGSELILKQRSDIQVLHHEERNGKIGAINRAMPYVKTPIVVFSDANTILEPQAIKEIIGYFSDPNTGCVAGEKCILKQLSDSAVSNGEGLYWKYESFIKKLESCVNSTIGAAGELYAIRTELFTAAEPDTILDDFVISMRIAQKGYAIKYASKAIASERASISIPEELKRKVRIGAGSMQTLIRMTSLLNIFKYKMLSYQYWSHKVIRWTVVPFATVLVLITNIYLVVYTKSTVYQIFILIQSIFYLLALNGWVFRNSKTRLRIIFAPYYMITMNYAIVAGIIRYIKGFQSVNWEKAKRL